MISAQRFKLLDEETNIPVADILSSTDSSPFNAVLNDGKNLLEDLKNESKGLVDNFMDMDVAKLTEPFVDTSIVGEIRKTKDYFSSVQNMAKLSTDGVDSIVNKLFMGNDIAKAAFSMIGRDCKDLILGQLGNCNGRKTSISFNGISRNTNKNPCGVDVFAAMVNKITNGGYKADIFDPCSSQKMLQGVVDRGFQIGMPGVFDAMASKIKDVGVLQSAGLDILSKAGLRGDINGVLEIANSKVGGLLKSLNPNVASMALSNFTIPSEVRAAELPEYYNDITTGIEKLDPDWASFKNEFLPAGDMLSTISLPKDNRDIKEVFVSKVMDNGIMISDWDTVNINDQMAMVTAMDFSESTTYESLVADFSNTSIAELTQTAKEDFIDPVLPSFSAQVQAAATASIPKDIINQTLDLTRFDDRTEYA
jgi:hypothetical protein